MKLSFFGKQYQLCYPKSYIYHRFSLLQTNIQGMGYKKIEKIETQSDEYTERLFNAKTLIFLLPFINYSSKGNDYNIIPLILLYEIFVVLLLKLFSPFTQLFYYFWPQYSVKENVYTQTKNSNEILCHFTKKHKISLMYSLGIIF